MNKLILALTVLLLSGCGPSPGLVHQAHIDAANQLCAGNGGMSLIKDGTRESEFEVCGYRCVRPTGRHTYKGTAVCSNGANFFLDFAK